MEESGQEGGSEASWGEGGKGRHRGGLWGIGHRVGKREGVRQAGERVGKGGTEEWSMRKGGGGVLWGMGGGEVGRGGGEVGEGGGTMRKGGVKSAVLWCYGEQVEVRWGREEAP